MKTLGIIMSFLFGMILLPSAQGQVICSNDYDYYYSNNKHYRHNYNRNHYRNNTMNLRSFERRIDNGVRTGELTRRETRKLRHELDKLISYRNRILRDGYISHRERRKYNKRKLRLDNMIYDKKHNRHYR